MTDNEGADDDVLIKKVIDYSDQLMNGFKILSLLFSVLIGIGIYSLMHHFKTRKNLLSS